MNSLISVKAWMWSVVIVTGLTGSAFARHGHGGGGGHHGGGGHGGGHHGGWSGGGGSHHHHGGYYGGGYGGYYRGYSGFGIGLGYGGYGYGGYPYGYGSGYYYSTPRYYYSTPTYVTPNYSYPSNVIIDSTPSAPAPTFDNGPIVILAPAANDAPVRYTLNGAPFTMKPGQSQKFRHDRDWIVEFDRGEGKGVAQYSLKASAYKFKKTDNGWELFEAAKPEPPVDPPVPMDDLK